MRRPSSAINKHRRATHQWILFMTKARRYAEDNKTDLIVRRTN